MYKLLVILDDGSTVIKTLPNDSFDVVLNKALQYTQQGFYWTDGESGLTTIYPASRIIKITMKKEEIQDFKS